MKTIFLSLSSGKSIDYIILVRNSRKSFVAEKNQPLGTMMYQRENKNKRWVLSIPFFISCIRQQNPLTVLSKIILRKVKQFNLPPQKIMEDFCIFEVYTPVSFL
ncbi:hypothetical protein ACIXNP_20735, partial [Bacteroides fragilis]